MKLSKRLETIVEQAALVCGGETAADVGTDHGFVPIRLIEEGAADRDCHGCAKRASDESPGACDTVWHGRAD